MSEPAAEKLERLRAEAEQLQLEALEARRLAAQATGVYRDALRTLLTPMAPANE